MSDEVVWRAGILYTMEPWVGLISYHNPARVIRKKIIQESCIKARLLFHVKGLQMEIVTAVKKYDSFLNTEYNLVLGRKCKSKTIRIIFDKYSWFHVGGIHYLTDIDINLNRRSIDGFYDDITEGRITEDYFRESSNYEGIQDRIELLSRLDEIVESLDNKLSCIYAFSKRDTKFYTTIDGDYLIVDLSSAEHPINLFLVFEKIDDNTIKPMSVFYPEIDSRSGKVLDYAEGQMRYTVLYNTKINIATGETTEIYRNPNYKESD